MSEAKICQLVNEIFPDLDSRMVFYLKMMALTQKELDIPAAPEVCDAEVLEFFKQVFPDGDHDKILKFLAQGLKQERSDQILVLCGPSSGRTTVTDLVRKAIDPTGFKANPVGFNLFQTIMDEKGMLLMKNQIRDLTFAWCELCDKTDINLEIVTEITNTDIIQYRKLYQLDSVSECPNTCTVVINAKYPKLIPDDHPNIWKYQMKNCFPEQNLVVKPGWVEATLRLLQKYL